VCVGVVQVFLLEDANALLAVGFGFCGAVGIDAAFGEEVGAPAGDNEGCPAVAISITLSAWRAVWVVGLGMRCCGMVRM
jgi:hypothetical protein